MNCKQGDLAIIVRSNSGHEGKILRCVKFLPQHHWRSPDLSTFFEDGWETDTHLKSWAGDVHCNYPDSQLRPIRDQDGEDEMLRIAGKPERMTA